MSLKDIQPSPLAEPTIVGSRAMQNSDLSSSGAIMDDRPFNVESTKRNPAPEISRKRKRHVPYHCNLFEGENEDGDPVRFVTVEPGMICEVLMTAGIGADAIVLHECSNHYTAGKLTEFQLDIDDAIYVAFSEKKEGNIDVTKPIVLTVLPKGEKSLNYVPHPTILQEGIYYYKLVELLADGSGVKLQRYLAGSHIFRRSGLTCDLHIKGCPTIDTETDITTEGPTLARVAFLSGIAVSLEDPIARPLQTIASGRRAEVVVEACCTPI